MGEYSDDVPPPPYSSVYNTPGNADGSDQNSNQNPQGYGTQQPLAAPPGYVSSGPGMSAQTYIVQSHPTQPGQVIIQYPVVPAQPLYGGTTSEPRDVMLLAVLATVFCFFPTGIMAVLKASEAKSHLISGDLHRANNASRQARKYINISIILGIIFFVILILLLVILPLWIHERYLKNF